MTARRRPPRTGAAGSDDLRPMLVEAASAVQDVLRSADGVGVTMLVGGATVYGCANGFATTIDSVQYRLMQGPCVEATVSGVVVRSGAIGTTTERRWPAFTGEAAALELRTVVSVPLRASGAVIGSLNLYGRDPAGLQDLDDTGAHEVGERVVPAVRNARLISIALQNGVALRRSVRTGARGPSEVAAERRAAPRPRAG